MKLSPKKGKVAAKETPAPEKKAKRKASRGGGDTMAKAKDFLVHHVEKVVLGGMALLALVLIYSGFSKEKIGTSPDSIKAVIQQARDTMTRPTWSDVKASRIPEPDKFDQTATLDTKQVSLNDYAWSQPLHPRLMERGKQRTDPELLAPIDLHVVSDYGPVAMRPADGQTGSNTFGNVEDPNAYPIPDKTASKMMVTRGGGNEFESRYLVSITGLLPYKKQFDIYQEALKDAAEYSPDRDVPKYLVMEVERAEVAADGTLGEWIKVDTFKAFDEEARWSSIEEAMADPEYLLPGTKGVVMNLPPMAMRDVSRWAVHPQVPKVQRNYGAGGGGGNVENRGGGNTLPADVAAGGPASIWNLGTGTRNDGGGRTSNDKGSAGTADNVANGQDVAQEAILHPNAMFRFIDFTVTPGKQNQYQTQAV